MKTRTQHIKTLKSNTNGCNTIIIFEKVFDKVFVFLDFVRNEKTHYLLSNYGFGLSEYPFRDIKCLKKF